MNKTNILMFFLVLSMLTTVSNSATLGEQPENSSVFSNAAVGLDATLLESKLIASDGAYDDRFGYSVSMDGNYCIIGAHADDDNDASSGSVYVFKYEGNGWVQQAKLISNDGEWGDHFGFSVSIDEDYCIIGTRFDDNKTSCSGSAYVFKREIDSWIQQAKITAFDASDEDYFGSSVAINGDYCVVGSFRDDDNGINSGSAYVFKREGKNWIHQRKLTAADGSSLDFFGYSVSIDGDYCIIGAYGDDETGDESGSAYVFKRDGENWVQQAKFIASDGAKYDYFGKSVSINGNYCVVGAFGDDDKLSSSGSAYVFKYDGESWSEQAKLLATDGTYNDRFGISVSINGDLCLIGANKYDENALNLGSAYLFKRTGEIWTQMSKITASDFETADYFGYSVSLDDDRCIVGAYKDEGNTYGCGCAYVYEMDTLEILPVDGLFSSGIQGTIFEPSSKEYTLINKSDALLDWTVEVSQPWITVNPVSGTLGLNDTNTVEVSINSVAREFLFGDYRDEIIFRNQNSGVKHIFAAHLDIGLPEYKFTAADGSHEDFFGRTVSMNGNYCIVGSNKDDDNGSDSGSAYVFKRNGNIWFQQAKLTAKDGAKEDYFGSAGSIDNNYC